MLTYRKYFLNLIAWSAGIEVPAAGIEASMVEETNRLLVPKPVRTLLPTGDDHPAQLLVLHYANCTAPGYQRRPKPGWLAISSAAAVWR